MRPEQAAPSTRRTPTTSRSGPRMHAVPRFLWNAKMRFGKTFASYQLAKKLGAKRVLVVTFKPAVEDAWQTDLESHVDFDGWQYLSRSGGDPTQIEADKTQAAGLLRLVPGPARPRRTPATSRRRTSGCTPTGTSSSSTSTTSVRGARPPRSCSRARTTRSRRRRWPPSTTPAWRPSNEELDELGNDEDRVPADHHPAYLYLSGTPFKALATGEFIEEQIFNWTYTDEQRAKAEFAVAHPDASGTRTGRCRRCGCSPTRCRTS
jgi:hypothetical protein